MTDLKLCPFCGSTAFLTEYDYDLGNGYVVTHVVECNGCHAQTFEYDSPEEAIEAWNRRTDAV